MSDLDLGIDIKLNTPEVQNGTKRMRDGVRSVNEEAKKGNDNYKVQEGLLERIKRRMQELNAEKLKASDTKSIEKYNSKIQQFQKEIERLNSIGKQGFDDMGKAIPDFSKPTGDLERMRYAADLYKKAIAEATSPEILAKYNAKLEQTEGILKRMANAGRNGFDTTGNAIVTKPTSTLGRLTYAANAYQDMAGNSANPEIIAKYNRKLQETQAEIARVRSMGKVGFDELGNKIVDNTKKTDSFIGGLKSLAGTIGVTFGINQIWEWGKALYQAASEASGIERAFSRIADKNTLAKLRGETGGFVKNLELQRLTVQANNLNVPIKDLGTYLAFASQRAKDTGESIEKLTGDIINGMGRESARIIDNLGISQKELNKEIAKTGNFAQAVANIMKRSMNEAGVAVDTLADKTSRLSTWWSNLWNKVSTGTMKMLNPTLADNEAIGLLTQNTLKAYADFDKKTADQREKTLSNYTKYVTKLSNQHVEAKRVFGSMEAGTYDYGLGNENATFSDAVKKVKESGERLAAAQNVLKTLRDNANKADVSERKKAGILNINELEEKITGLTVKFKDTLDPKERANLKKQIDEAQKLLDKWNGKSDKSGKSDGSEVILRAEQSLQERILALKDKYNRKSLDKDEEARQAIIDEFKVMAGDIEKQVKVYDDFVKKHGQAKANKAGLKRPDGSSLEPIRDAAIADLTYRQQTERIKIQNEEQKRLYDEFEKYKTSFGEARAKERFGKLINIEMTYLQQLQTAYALMYTQGLLTGFNGALKERMAAQEKSIKSEKDVDQKSLDEAYISVQSQAEKLLQIKQRYVKIINKLGANITEAQRAELMRQMDDEIKTANQTAFEKTAIYRRMNEETILYTREALKAEIKAVENILKDADLDTILRSKIESDLLKLKGYLAQGVGTTNKAALHTQKKNLEAALVDPLITGTEEAEKYRLKLIEIQKQIDETSDGGAFSKMFEGDTAQIAGNVSTGLDQISGSFAELSASLEGTNDGLAYTLGSIGQLTKVAGDAAGAVASFASGDIIGGVTKTISAVAGLFSMGKKVREMNEKAREEQKKFYDDALKGEREYQELLRKRELDEVKRGKNSYKSIIAQLELLKKQSPEIQAAYDKIFSSLQGQGSVTGVGYQHGTWFRKAKTWDIMASLMGSGYDDLEKLYSENKLKDQAKTDFESLRALRDELKAAGLDVADLQVQLNELLTGTSVNGLTDSLTQLFENGKFAAADFGKSFEDILKTAMISSFKVKFLQDQLAPWFEEFGTLMQSSAPDQQQIDVLRKKFEEIGIKGAEYWKQMEAMFGIKMSTPSSSGGGVAAKIADAITENTGSEIVGTNRANYDLNKQHLAVSKGIATSNIKLIEVSENGLAEIKASVVALQNIEKHTENTVTEAKNIVQELKTLNKNMTPQGTRATS